MFTPNATKVKSTKAQIVSKYSDCEDAQSFNSSNASSSESLEKTNDDTVKKYRTELCKFYEISGTCKFGLNCIFAHGKENLREKVLVKSGYKKRECLNFFEHGLCLYGKRCQFSHDIRDETTLFSYKAVMKDISKGIIVNKDYEIFNRPRLNVFKDIIRKHKKKPKKKGKINNKTYFDDIIKYLHNATV